ncbi:hypothetical protein [Priestia megaterium]|uniref:hypothetical protein n=1 Tax=Priestia megaterium TaxID=1404 RepID=UPI002E1BEEF0|nr:hypothetical protein [Priestia megaterium]
MSLMGLDSIPVILWILGMLFVGSLILKMGSTFMSYVIPAVLLIVLIIIAETYLM